jgi:polysaccharide pyruvyl transferase WcaK-like protein
MKNILFSTTRQWNPGDEFILFGTINILEKTHKKFNKIIYNRNPEIRQTMMHLNPLRTKKFSKIFFKGLGRINAFIRIGFFDNSFKDQTDPKLIDLVVFAGSPEWIGNRLRSLYEMILKNNIPVIFLGIGTGQTSNQINLTKINEPFLSVLKKSLIITTRDEELKEKLKEINAICLPCPALFSSKTEKKIKKVKKIGLIYATNDTIPLSRVNKKTEDYLIKIYPELIKKYDCEIICHYIDDLEKAEKIFKNCEINYSFDAKDYIKIYKKFDLVVGTRLHGIGISASMGIPGILIGHDSRTQTAKGFLADISEVGEKEKLSKIIEKNIKSIHTKNKEIIIHKKHTMKKYIKLIKEKTKIK